jgi:hypothetical protein
MTTSPGRSVLQGWRCGSTTKGEVRSRQGRGDVAPGSVAGTARLPLREQAKRSRPPSALGLQGRDRGAGVPLRGCRVPAGVLDHRAAGRTARGPRGSEPRAGARLHEGRATTRRAAPPGSPPPHRPVGPLGGHRLQGLDPLRPRPQRVPYTPARGVRPAPWGEAPPLLGGQIGIAPTAGPMAFTGRALSHAPVASEDVTGGPGYAAGRSCFQRRRPAVNP